MYLWIKRALNYDDPESQTLRGWGKAEGADAVG